MCKHLDARCAQVPSYAIWLLISSALSRLERSWGDALRPLVHAHLLGKPSDSSSIKSYLSEMARSTRRAWSELAETRRKLWHDLQRTSSKIVGAQDRIWREIAALEKTAAAIDLEAHSAYHYEWMRGRWHVLSGHYQEAIPHYEHAFELACYRAGHQIEELISEASCITAFIGKKPFLKKLKHVGIALGIFRKPEGGISLENWEFDQFAQQLPRLFPAQGRFTECQNDLAEHSMQGFLLLDKDTLSKTLPDLKNANRVRAVHFVDGSVRRWPQLSLFASFGPLEHVKALLDAGASVDELDSSGGSALLGALQNATSTGNREVLELLLARTHQVATLNAQTQRKRLTPLMCAIEFGQPDVVESLIAQGADVEKCALTDNQSPLYYLVSQLSGKVNPGRMLLTLVQKMKEPPEVVLQDTLRRFGANTAGTFGSDLTALRLRPELTNEIIKHIVSNHVSRHNVFNLMQIATILLKAGANPNAPHAYPVPGRTPMMLAAENDLLELFDLMLRHGGNPLIPDASGNNCIQIALSFRAIDILNYLGGKHHFH